MRLTRGVPIITCGNDRIEDRVSDDLEPPTHDSRDDLIRELYRSILHREADPSGLEHYRQVANVKSPEVFANFGESGSARRVNQFQGGF